MNNTTWKLSYKICILLLGLAGGIKPAQAQGSLAWVKGFGGLASEECRSMAIDASGNIYIAGGYRSTADFDPGPDSANLVANGISSDIFVCKLDAAGDYVWAKSIGGLDFDAAKSVAVDASGNVYITGQFSGSVNFDPASSSGTATLQSNGKEDIFICKLDANGNYVWAKSMGSTLTDQAFSIAVGKSGDVYVTGYYSAQMDANPGSGSTLLTSKGSMDIYVLKLNKEGDYVWAKSIGGGWVDWAEALTLDQSDNVYITGFFSSDANGVDFDPALTGKKLISKGAPDIFALKLDQNGNYVWAKNFGGGFQDIGGAVAVDGAGNVYLTGYFTGFGASFDTIKLSAHSVVDPDIFVCKLNPSGGVMWAKSMGGSSLGGSVEQGSSIALDPYGNIYTTGLFKEFADFDPGPLVANLISSGNDDVFISKLDNNGNYLGAKNVGGLSSDKGQSIALVGGNVFVQGTFQGKADFDPDAGTTYLVNNGSTSSDDIFILKLFCNDTSSSELTESVCGSFTLNGQTYTSSGTFNQILLNAAGCDSTVTLNLTIIQPDTSVSVNGSTFSSNSLSASAYQWVRCDQNYAPINGAIGQSFIAQEEGSYAVIVTENGCTDTSACYSYTKETGVESLQLEENVKVYPNPANDHLFIKAGHALQNASFKLITITGQTLMEQKNINGNTNSINLAGYAPGIYLIEIAEGSEKARQKLVITK